MKIRTARGNHYTGYYSDLHSAFQGSPIVPLTQYTLTLLRVCMALGFVTAGLDLEPERSDGLSCAGSLRYLLPKDIPFFITSATLPPDVLQDVMATLGMSEAKTEIFWRSNDRSNIYLTVRKMKYPLNSFKDLAFLIPPDWDGTTPLPWKFVIFFASITESIAAAQYLRTLVPVAFREKIKWFNSEMSPEFRAEESDKFNSGKIFGLFCTESFGMGIDMPNITLVIQWRATCDMCTLWQRFGRGARDPNCEAIALWLVEPMYFDKTKEEKAANKAKREEKKKRKACEQLTGQPPAKKTRSTRSDGTSRTVGSTRSSAVTPPSDLTTRFLASPPRPRNASATPQSTTVTQHTDPAPSASVLEADSDSEAESDGETNRESLEERRLAYRKDKEVVTAKKTRKRKDGNELSPEMDDMCNAGSERRCIKCFRLPSQLYFGNDKTVSDHLQCRDDLPDGCPRCVVKPSSICSPQIPSKSRIAAYEADVVDMSLRDELHQFRREATVKKFSRAVLRDNGPGIIMSNEVLQRIVDCAHFHKIESQEQLKRETRWAGAAEFGDEVLSLIAKHRPKPISTPDPLAPCSENAGDTASVRSRKC
ncbi:p-loop containing nucleoside triphosphate hydrolase protein [Mycena sanguinolenta]|uniref:DNA 3'-5' helicase n=1 Tax=Mycena sanguinolenta TaxID=230812 RepID=A0A8H6Y754_9AGAR|nr:p-loop containing nucleoside triphosphate hydrolase protein [Mycena sanguinolenta]